MLFGAQSADDGTVRESASANTAAGRSAAGLVGTVRGPDEEPLGGIAVYAKGVSKTITTTVFTNEQGAYVFPGLEPGPYRMWAQAAGFETSHASVTLQAEQRTAQAFALRTIADVSPQLSAAEWMAALPVDTKDQRRVKEILRVNCAMCHSIASVLQHRYDEQGWLAMVDQMARYNRANRRPTVEFHKEELAKYLVSVRGPDSPPRARRPQARQAITILSTPVQVAPEPAKIIVAKRPK